MEDLYDMMIKEMDRIGLSRTDLAILCMIFIQNGGGSTADFREWVCNLDGDSARDLIRGS